MSKVDKRGQRIRKNINNVSLEDFEALICKYGKIVTGGDHPEAYIHAHVFPYKRRNPVSAYYVESILRIIDGIKGE
jgi:hypothetical protein